MAKYKGKTVQASKGLRLRVPENDSGLMVPEQLNDEVEDRVPLDFTSLSSREVGRQHSAWAVRHSYVLYLMGNLKAEIGNVKHDIKLEEMSFRAKHGAQFKTKAAADAALSVRKRMRKLRERLDEGEVALARLEGIAASYEALRNAASREMSRRSEERAAKD